MIPMRLVGMGYGIFLDKTPDPNDEERVYPPQRGEPTCPLWLLWGRTRPVAFRPTRRA